MPIKVATHLMFEGTAEDNDNRTKFPKTFNPQTAGMVFRSLD
jgi:hypothetical protein